MAQGLHIKKQVVITLDIAAVQRSKKYVQLVMDFSKNAPSLKYAINKKDK